jgi:hypothetical protein
VKTIWYVEQVSDKATLLQATLQAMTADGWTVHTILTNGINQWTIICNKTT